ncbi:MAG: nucleotide exchange factor GrpE [Clostridiaceae bacterium]|nr:nucleotide exchange factor GrpE [Clostridiaceae bacterium]
MNKNQKLQNNEEQFTTESDELLENVNEENLEMNEEDADTEGDSSSLSKEELKDLQLKLDEKSIKCEEYFTMLQRTTAEFDNYKKRTAKEKDSLYSDAVSDVVAAFLPVLDNIERAIQASESESGQLKEGVELIYRQFKEIMSKLGVEDIEAVGNSFDPKLHNAVMHIDDDSFSENVIVEEFQKGYILKDRVIRHSMVKVAN